MLDGQSSAARKTNEESLELVEEIALRRPLKPALWGRSKGRKLTDRRLSDGDVDRILTLELTVPAAGKRNTDACLPRPWVQANRESGPRTLSGRCRIADLTSPASGAAPTLWAQAARR